MIYVLDSSALSALFRNYYPERFPTLWKLFEGMNRAERFTSTREVYRELEDLGGPVMEWANQNKALFVTPDAKEGVMVSRIYGVAHFQANIERQKLLKGGKVADPFVVARAAVIGGAVVTTEKLRPHAAKIPNICDHFKVKCFDLEGFMAAEKWQF